MPRGKPPTGYGRGRPKNGEVREKRTTKKFDDFRFTDEQLAEIKGPTRSMFSICDAGIHMKPRSSECPHCRKGLGPTPNVVTPDETRPRLGQTYIDAHPGTSSPLAPPEPPADPDLGW